MGWCGGGGKGGGRGGGSVISKGVRYIDEILSEADISAFLKLSATYRYQKIEIYKLSKKLSISENDSNFR